MSQRVARVALSQFDLTAAPLAVFTCRVISKPFSWTQLSRRRDSKKYFGMAGWQGGKPYCLRMKQPRLDSVSIRCFSFKTSSFGCFTVLSNWAGVVLQCGVAQHGVLPQRWQQRYPEGKSSGRRGPSCLWHLGVQLPPQPHQGAAVLLCHVSHPKRTAAANQGC